jgi:hypothetical protein
MIAADTAARLRTGGLRWDPAPGDRFIVDEPEMAGQVFVVSDMTVEVHRHPQGTSIGFNGTTEWALDSVDQRRTLWLPREDQLRALLGGTFRRLDRTPGGDWSVHIEVGTQTFVAIHDDPEQAYALALAHLVERAE